MKFGEYNQLGMKCLKQPLLTPEFISDWKPRLVLTDLFMQVEWELCEERKGEPAIHLFIKEPRYQRVSLCIRITGHQLVNQVGYGKEHQEFAWVEI